MNRREFVLTTSAFSAVSNFLPSSSFANNSRKLNDINIKGFTLASWGELGITRRRDVRTLVNYFQSCGANSVQLNVQINIDRQGNFVGFKHEDSRHAQLKDLNRVANEITQLGMKVLFKPWIASAGKAALRYELQEKGFENQLGKTVIRYFDELANNVDLNQFEIITLPGELTGIDNGNKGVDIFAPAIEHLRSVFGGKLTYHPGLYGEDNKFYPAKVKFWDLLDLISVSFYPRIHVGAKNSLSISSERARQSKRLKEDFQNLLNLSGKFNKKIFLAECGYPSHKFGLNDVNGWNPKKWGGRVDSVQAVGLDALFHNLYDHKNSFEGFALWGHHGGTLQQMKKKHVNYEIEFATIGKDKSTEIIKQYLLN